MALFLWICGLVCLFYLLLFVVRPVRTVQHIFIIDQGHQLFEWYLRTHLLRHWWSATEVYVTVIDTSSDEQITRIVAALSYKHPMQYYKIDSTDELHELFNRIMRQWQSQPTFVMVIERC